MLGLILIESQCVLKMKPNSFPPPLIPPRRRSATSSPIIICTNSIASSPSSPSSSTQSSFVLVNPPLLGMPRNVGFRPSPQLALFSLFFPLSMAFGAFISVALVSIPAMIAFVRLGASMKKLSKVASEEIPGTIFSLKLSMMEVNDLAQEMRNLSQMISAIRRVKDRRNKDS